MSVGAEGLDLDFARKLAKFSGFEVLGEDTEKVWWGKKIYKQAGRNGQAEENPKKKINAFKKVKLEGKANAIDEEVLLKNDEVGEKLKTDCSTQPKACKNCSCGRKELEDEMETEQLEKLISQGGIKSECGSCFLGDAFRCATCPYKGLPAFQPGDKIKLDLRGEVPVNEKRDAESVKVVGGKVKIEL